MITAANIRAEKTFVVGRSAYLAISMIYGRRVALLLMGWFAIRALPAAAQDEGGLLWVAGVNRLGYLGVAARQDARVPLAMRVTTAGGWETRAIYLREDRSLWLLSRESGNAPSSDAGRPAQVAAGVSAFAAGWQQLLFIKDDRSLWSLDNAAIGGLGNTSSVPTAAPVEIAQDVAACAAGAQHILYV
jgi:hypothetical protein